MCIISVYVPLGSLLRLTTFIKVQYQSLKRPIALMAERRDDLALLLAQVKLWGFRIAPGALPVYFGYRYVSGVGFVGHVLLQL